MSLLDVLEHVLLSFTLSRRTFSVRENCSFLTPKSIKTKLCLCGNKWHKRTRKNMHGIYFTLLLLWKKKSPVLTSMYFHYCSQHVQCVHARVCVGCALTVSNLRQEQRQECDLSAASTRLTCWNPRSVCSYGLCRTQPHGTSWWHSATWTAPTQPLRTHGPTCFLFFLHTIVLVDSRRWLTVRFRIKVKEKHAKPSMKSCFLFLFFFFFSQIPV